MSSPRIHTSIIFIGVILLLVLIMVVFYVITETNLIFKKKKTEDKKCKECEEDCEGGEDCECGEDCDCERWKKNSIDVHDLKYNLDEIEKQKDLSVYSDKEDSRPQVYNISDNLYGYDDAEAVCNAHDGELANLDQVVDAYKDGADWCNYGWSENQLALYPTQKEKWVRLQKNSERRDECGKPGINGGYFENKDILLGVNCYGPKPVPKESELKKPFQDYMLNPLEYKTQKYRDNLDDIEIAPFNKDKWSQYN